MYNARNTPWPIVTALALTAGGAGMERRVTDMGGGITLTACEKLSKEQSLKGKMTKYISLK